MSVMFDPETAIYPFPPKPLPLSRDEKHFYREKIKRLLRERDSTSHAPAPVDLAKDRRGLRIAKDDMAQFSRAVERDFNDLAARYYLNLCGDPKIRVSRDRITVTFDLAKEE